MAWVMDLPIQLDPEDTVLCGLPVFHVFAVHTAGLTPLYSGRHNVFVGPDGFRDAGVITNLWAIVEKFGVATFSAVPTVLQVLAQVPVDADISSLRFVYSGAAPLAPATRAAFTAHTGVPVREGYGQTEATCACASTPSAADPVPGATGLRLPYQQIRIAGRLTGPGARQDSADTPGRVEVRGPNVFAGYLGQGPSSPVDDDGWLDTGDLGRLRDGWLFLTGRTRDPIIRGGHNIDPAHIEDTLLTHPAVRSAAAVGRSDAHSGEVPVAYVALLPGQEAPTAQELIAWAEQRIGEWAAIPKDVTCCAELPVTAVGKVNKVPPARGRRSAGRPCPPHPGAPRMPVLAHHRYRQQRPRRDHRDATVRRGRRSHSEDRLAAADSLPRRHERVARVSAVSAPDTAIGRPYPHPLSRYVPPFAILRRGRSSTCPPPARRKARSAAR